MRKIVPTDLQIYVVDSIDIEGMLQTDSSLRPLIYNRTPDLPTNEGGGRVVAPNIIDSNTRSSRYINDFEEIGWVGKGAFGEVVKANNLIGIFLVF